MEGVRSAVEERDLATVTDICHQLKSNSANIGAIEFSGLCRRLETAAWEGDLEGCKASIAEFVETGQAAMNALKDYLAEFDRNT